MRRILRMQEESFSVGENGPDQFHVIDLSAAGVDSLQQFINLFIAHLFSQVRKDVSELADSDETCHVFVEYLKAAAIFFWFARISETARSVEDFAEGFEINCTPISSFLVSASTCQIPYNHLPLVSPVLLSLQALGFVRMLEGDHRGTRG